MKIDTKDYHPYNDILNEVKVPLVNEDNKITLARCIKVPLFEIFTYNKA